MQCVPCRVLSPNLNECTYTCSACSDTCVRGDVCVLSNVWRRVSWRDKNKARAANTVMVKRDKEEHTCTYSLSHGNRPRLCLFGHCLLITNETVVILLQCLHTLHQQLHVLLEQLAAMIVENKCCTHT